jgi:hypothetical protein
MALVDFSINDMTGGYFHETDVKVVNNPNYFNKLKNFFSQTNFDVSVTIGKNPGDFKDGVFNIWIPHDVTAYYNPMTPWIVAHRMFHELTIFNNRDERFICDIKKRMNMSENEINHMLRFHLDCKSSRELKLKSLHDTFSEAFALHLNGGIKFINPNQYQDKINLSQFLAQNFKKFNVMSPFNNPNYKVTTEHYSVFNENDVCLDQSKVNKLHKELTEMFDEMIQHAINVNFAKKQRGMSPIYKNENLH